MIVLLLVLTYFSASWYNGAAIDASEPSLLRLEVEIEAPTTLPRFALVLAGRVVNHASYSKSKDKNGTIVTHSEVGNGWSKETVDLVDWKLCWERYLRHLLHHNGGRKNWDVFAHIWTVEVEKEMREVVKPRHAIFEENLNAAKFIDQCALIDTKRNDTQYGHSTTAHQALGMSWGKCSWRYSLSKAFSLVQAYEDRHQHAFDAVVFVRPDALIWSNVNMSGFNFSHVYMHQDFFWAMSSTSARMLNESLFSGEMTSHKYWDLNDVVFRTITPGLKPLEDGRSFCKNTELVRKMPICCGKLKSCSECRSTYSTFSEDEIRRMKLLSHCN